jgi:hypothetical protein
MLLTANVMNLFSRANKEATLRRFFISVLFLLSIVGVLNAQSATTLPMSFLRQEDILVLYIQGNQTVNIDGLGIQTTNNGVTTLWYLGEFAAFQGLPLDNFKTPVCFVLRPQRATTPLPQACQSVTVHTQQLFASDIFWYSAANFQPLSFAVINGTDRIADCPADNPTCVIDFPILEPVLPTATPVIVTSGECLITAEMNLLVSADSDDDKYSDFEEACVFQTPINEPTPDTDGDGVPDATEISLTQINPDWANVTRADPDRDGDWLFDIIEVEIGTDPSVVDTDGDFMSDFIEFWWQVDDPRTLAPDRNANYFPDVLEGFLPPNTPATRRCELDVRLILDEMWVVGPEEADSFDIVVGDEPEMVYGLDLENASIDNRYRQQWAGEGIEKDTRLANFTQVPSRTLLCGEVPLIFISLIENDAPFGGIANLGEERTPVPLIFQRIPIAWHLAEPTESIFSGIVEDGAYDYRIRYRLEVIPLN